MFSLGNKDNREDSMKWGAISIGGSPAFSMADKLEEAKARLEQTLAIRRKGLVNKALTTPSPADDSRMYPENESWSIHPIPASSAISRDIPIETPIVSPAVLIPDIDITQLMEGVKWMEHDLETVFPWFSQMDPDLREEIMHEFAQQETGWDTLAPVDIVISKSESKIWGGLFTTAKKSDFVKAVEITNIAPGEIVDITIEWFVSFQIVKIRSKTKDGHVMALIEFVRQDPINKKPIKWSGDYFLTLPLIEGRGFSLLRKETMRPFVTYKILKMSLNIKQQSLIQKFFDIFV